MSSLYDVRCVECDHRFGFTARECPESVRCPRCAKENDLKRLKAELARKDREIELINGEG